VGKVKDVFPHTAQVLAINDQTSGAGVLLEQTRMRGVLRGNAYGQPQIINVLPDERIKPGEKVVTSGGDQIFPRGLAVGTVQKIVTDPEHEPYVDIVLKPAANLQHLEEVLIVTQTSDELPAAAQRDLAKSLAAGAQEAEMRRASDVLSEKLPGLEDANAPKSDAALANPQLLKPLMAARADRFTPGTAPPASQMTPGKVTVITSSARTNELLNEGAQAVRRTKKPAINPDGSVPADGSATPAPRAKPQSFIIPGTATGPDRPLRGPEKANASITSTPARPTSASGEQHQ
jgi:rod shape-determining protein MreC